MDNKVSKEPLGCPFEMFFIAAGPFPEKAIDGKLYCDPQEADVLRKERQMEHLGVFKCFVSVVKKPIFEPTSHKEPTRITLEPKAMRSLPAEHCVDCGEPTRFWMKDMHTPLCQDCCYKRNL
jgi:hypothetical protein